MNRNILSNWIAPALVVAIGACPTGVSALAPWQGWPAWLETPEHVREAQYLPGMDPADVDWATVEARKPALARLLRESGPTALFDALMSEDDVLIREKLIVDFNLRLAETSGADALPSLDQLAAKAPESRYLAPGCKQPHEHILFNTRATARFAADRIRFREAYAEGVASRADSASNPRARLLAEDKPARLAGLLAAAPDAAAFARDEAFLRELKPLQAETLLRHFQKAGDGRSLLETARRLDGPMAQEALLALRGARGDVSAEELLALGLERRELLPSALAALEPRDANPSVVSNLAGLFADAKLGADAAHALQRIDPDAARTVATASLQSDELVAVRRALLILMRDGGAEARDAVEAFIKMSDDAPELALLRERGTQWLAE